MKKVKHDPTVCLLSARYCWEASRHINTRFPDAWQLVERASWTWLFRWAGMPI